MAALILQDVAAALECTLRLNGSRSLATRLSHSFDKEIPLFMITLVQQCNHNQKIECYNNDNNAYICISSQLPFRIPSKCFNEKSHLHPESGADICTRVA